MKLRTAYHYFAILMLCSFTQSYAREALQVSDINKVMKQLLSQHVSKKEITPALIRASLKGFIDQLDPRGIYLLESEVHPYLDPTDEEMDSIITQYNSRDYSIYQKLNSTMDKAIERARKLRVEIANSSKDSLFLPNAEKLITGHEYNVDSVYPENIAQLKARIKYDMIQFILAQKKLFGDASVLKHKERVIVMYDNDMRHTENAFLYTDEKGKPVSQIQQDNLFALHVLKALASTLDAHTKFLDNEEAYDMKSRLEKEFQGIGVDLQEKPEGIVVNSVLPDGPAAKNGNIKIKDLIIAIDGEEIEDDSFEDVLKMLHGPKGSAVELTLKRPIAENGDKFETIKVRLVRADIPINEGRVETSYEKVGNGILGKITLHSFYQSENGITSVDDVKNAIENLEKIGNLRGLILDLRDNSGGFLTQAVKVVGLFITEGVVVISKYSNGEEHFYRDIDNDDIYSGPLVILTSKETASAAEIVAQALQDYGVALIVGDQHTFGKGTIQSQTVTGNEGSTYFKVTVGKYYTVSGKTPQKSGVPVDIVVPGHLNKEQIGEKYLDYTEKSDKIAAVYDDPLSDVEPNQKSWYMRYYTPHIQKAETVWKNMVPLLKKNSSQRIGTNTSYQDFLKQKNPPKNNRSPVSLVATDSLNQEAEKDLQLQETVNIVKDMITLQSVMDRGKDSLED